MYHKPEVFGLKHQLRERNTSLYCYETQKKMMLGLLRFQHAAWMQGLYVFLDKFNPLGANPVFAYSDFIVILMGFYSDSMGY